MPKRLTEHLISRGLLSAEQGAAALEAQHGTGGSLDTQLLEQGTLSEAELLRAVSEVSGQRAIDLGGFEVNHQVASLIPPKIADRLGLVPLSLEGEALHVACCYPIPSRELREISFLLNKRLELWIGLEVRIRSWMQAIYGAPLSKRFASLQARLDSGRTETQKKKTTAFAEERTLEDSLSRALIDRLARSIVDEPIQLNQIALSQPVQSDSRSDSAEEEVGPADDGVPEERDDGPSPVMALHTRPALSKLPGPAPGSVPVRRYGAQQPQAIPDWTLAQARSALKRAAKDRDQIIDVTLRFARQTFEFTAVFAMVRGAATVWKISGEQSELQSPKPTHPAIPIDVPSVFRTVCTTRRSYVGPLPPDPLTRQFLEQLGRSPRTIFLYPVEVGGRLVAILYGDCAHRPMSRRRLSDFVLFCQHLPGVFQELILLRRRHLNDGTAHRPEKDLDRERALPESIAKVVWTPPEDGGETNPVHSPRPRRAPTPQRPPADFAEVLRKLIGPDPEERAGALAELARSPPASADELIRHFPGPTGWSRVPVFDLPQAEELGPIPAALSSLGQPAARALAPLLDSNDAETRYFALLTAGSLPYPELVDGIMRGLFAVEPEISSAARSAATAFRGNRGFDRAIKHLRQELAATDSLRRSLAARALGGLHDRDSIDGLIGLTGSEDQACAEAAAEALREITKAPLGRQTREWRMWWAENREKRRAEWLVAALRSRDVHLRLSAIQELSKAFNDNLGYFADAPMHERRRAIDRWESLVGDSDRNRRVEV